MKRREAFQLIPLSIAGMTGLARNTFSCEMHFLPEPPHSEPLAVRYTKKVREMLTWIRRTQSENLLEASYAVARTVKNKGTCWYNWATGHSHMFDMSPGRNGLPEIFTGGYNSGKVKKGDLYFANRGTISVEDRKTKNLFVIGGPVPWGQDAKMPELIERESAKHRNRPNTDIWIETNITTLGAVMFIPGMPAPVGPVAGIIGIVTLWMIIADACRILAREGISVPVRGDEPILSGDNIPWVSLHEPLMDDYFDRVIRQIEMIGAERGNISEIAKMAVDSVLAGGRVYGYSRDRLALAGDAQHRRGGLALFSGIYDKDGSIVDFSGKPFKGSPKDLVIMGIFKPDDEGDLRNLDRFRKFGMKVVSIGPKTRDNKIPDGRTVPEETDVHAGRMCDTYGLYAVSGFERKVCPTSGALIMQIFWEISMEIVDEIMRRTGNVPCVYFSAAIKGGSKHNSRMNQIVKERGY